MRRTVTSPQRERRRATEDAGGKVYLSWLRRQSKASEAELMAAMPAARRYSTSRGDEAHADIMIECAMLVVQGAMRHEALITERGIACPWAGVALARR